MTGYRYNRVPSVTPQPSAGVPTRVLAGETYTVPQNEQVLFTKRIRLEAGARIKVFGTLVQPR